MLFVPESRLSLLADELHSIRRAYGYSDEIHWREIKSASRHSPPFLVARDWMQLYVTTAMKSCPFKAWITEDGPNRRFPYPGDANYPEHLLRSTLSTFLGGIAWSFHGQDKLRLEMIFDDTDAQLDRDVALKTPEILQTECNMRRVRASKRYPWLRADAVRFVSSDPRKVSFQEWPYSELIQLCDLLLGASFQALELTPQPDMTGRRQLAKSIMRVLGETLEVPWLQQAPVHRKFFSNPLSR